MMSKKKADHKTLRDEDDDTESLLVSLGFTPQQVDAMVIALNDKNPVPMVQAGFWAYVAQMFAGTAPLNTDDLVRAGFSSAQAEVIAA
jgi:Holliday junction resolvasome RuvABC DNA-binding subunit